MRNDFQNKGSICLKKEPYKSYYKIPIDKIP